MQQNRRPKEFPKPPAPAPAPAPVTKPAPTPPKAKVSSVPNSGQVRNPNSVALPTGQSHESMFRGAVEKHKLDTVKLLTESAAKGEKSVSIAAIGKARKVNIAMMRHANDMALKQRGGKHRTEQEITAALSKAENDAVQLYIVEARKKQSS